MTFDITDALSANQAEQVLAVRVTTRSKGWNFDNMDSWSLSGIYRDVTVLALPRKSTSNCPTGAAARRSASILRSVAPKHFV